MYANLSNHASFRKYENPVNLFENKLCSQQVKYISYAANIQVSTINNNKLLKLHAEIKTAQGWVRKQIYFFSSSIICNTTFNKVHYYIVFSLFDRVVFGVTFGALFIT